MVGLSGGLIGPEGTPRDYEGGFDQTPVFLGCSDVDPYIPVQSVVETGHVLKRMGADVAVRFYPGMGHMVGVEELTTIKDLMASI